MDRNREEEDLQTTQNSHEEQDKSAEKSAVSLTPAQKRAANLKLKFGANYFVSLGRKGGRSVKPENRPWAKNPKLASAAGKRPKTRRSK